jgi:hypothetical protein
MKRILKAFGLSTAAVLVLGMFSASTALANFHSEASHTELRGEQIGNDTFTVNAGTMKCTEGSVTGTIAASTTSTVTGAPKIGGCTAFGFVNATVDTSGCIYEVTTQVPVFTLHIRCTTPITITAFNCWVTVGEQSISGGSYTNTGSGSSRDLDVAVNVSGIKYTQHSKSFPGCANGTFTNGTYVGSETVRGFNTAGSQVGVWIQ